MQTVNAFLPLLRASSGRRHIVLTSSVAALAPTPRQGAYVVSKFATEPASLPEYERALRLDDGVIRYLITLHEHEVGAPPQSEEDLVAATHRDDDDDDED